MQRSKSKIIVSACLAGVKCRYDGKDNLVPEIRQMVLDGKAIALCPEELGGLPTPRIPCEIVNRKNFRIVNRENINCSHEFKSGANKVVEIAKILDAKLAILKANSPSCGFGEIYDGTFSGKLCKGNGITAEILHQQNLKILNEENFREELSNL